MPNLNFANTMDLGEDLPAGDYHVKVTNVEERETGENAKHPDNPFWNIELTVQSGDFDGRKLWTNAMLPPGYEPITLKNLLAATSDQHEVDLESEDAELEAEDLLGLEAVAVQGKNRNGELNVKRFKEYDPDASDLMP